MKKNVLILAACLMAFALNAQDKPFYRTDVHQFNPLHTQAPKVGHNTMLASISASDHWEGQEFSFDNHHHLVAVHDWELNSYDVIDSIFYDNDGNIERVSGWQLLNGTRRNVYYVQFTYDQNHNRTSRTNYNWYDNQWTLGGVYNYTYNDNNQIVLTTLTMAGMNYQRIEYTYKNGLLDTEMWFDFDGAGLSASTKITYEYEGNNLVCKRDSSMNQNGQWAYQGYYTYTYDEYNNVIEYHYYDYTSQETERSIYRYDYTLPLNECLIPWHPEMGTRPATYNNTHAMASEEWYMVDVDHVLQYVCDFIYNYEDSPLGIKAPASAPLSLNPNPSTSNITIAGLPQQPSTLQVLDITGRQVMSTTVSAEVATVDVSALPAGCYVVRVINNGELRTAKLVKE